MVYKCRTTKHITSGKKPPGKKPPGKKPPGKMPPKKIATRKKPTEEKCHRKNSTRVDFFLGPKYVELGKPKVQIFSTKKQTKKATRKNGPKAVLKAMILWASHRSTIEFGEGGKTKHFYKKEWIFWQ